MRHMLVLYAPFPGLRGSYLRSHASQSFCSTKPHCADATSAALRSGDDKPECSEGRYNIEAHRQRPRRVLERQRGREDPLVRLLPAIGSRCCRPGGCLPFPRMCHTC